MRLNVASMALFAAALKPGTATEPASTASSINTSPRWWRKNHAIAKNARYTENGPIPIRHQDS
jgi:hypothetical protein